MRLKSIIALFLTVGLVFGCGPTDAENLQERARKAGQATGDIVIGAVDTSTIPSFFLEGVRLAVEEINGKGGVGGRNLKIVAMDDKGQKEIGQRVARQLADNTDVVAVVGFLRSAVAIPAAITFAQNGVLFLSPGASNPLLTAPRSPFVFRNIPTDRQSGQQLADFAIKRGFTSTAVFFQQDGELRSLATEFQEQAATNGVSIVATRSFFSWQNEFRPVLSEIQDQYRFDSLFIAGLLPVSGRLIRQIRDMGISVPILAGDGLDSPSLLTVAGKASEGTVVASVFNPQYPGKATQDFVNRFQARYGFEPDTWAAQGYDAVSVIAYAMEDAGSTVPIEVAADLRFLEDWQGVTGTYSFTPSGDITGRFISFKQVRNGQFVYLKSEEKQTVSLSDYVADFTLRLPIERAVSTIDPGHISNEASSIDIAEQLFLGLTGLDPDTYQAVPELAVSWTVSENGRVYTFKMRDDVQWTNGKPVTAHDVVWAVRRNILPETQSPGWYMLQIIENADAIRQGSLEDVSKLGVRALDDYTVEFRLKHAASFFPAIAGLWVFCPLPREAIETYGDKWTQPENIQTNGPYKLALWEKGMGLVLVKNPNFYDAGNVSIPEVRYFVIPQGHLGLKMYENDELDIMGGKYLELPAEDIAQIKANPELNKEYSLQPQFCTYAYAFNAGLAPVDKPLVRKALAAAIDRRLAIDVVTGGDEKPATTFTCPPVFGAVDPDDGIGIAFDPKQARKWLAEAGFPDGKGFPTISLLYPGSVKNRLFAQAVKGSLSHFLNIDITLSEKDPAEFDRIVKMEEPPHMFLLHWCADYPDANNFLNEVFAPSKPLYHFNWQNDAFEDVVNRAADEQDPAARKTLFQQAEKILCQDEAVVIPIFYDQAHSLVKPRIKGWYQMVIGGQHIRDWSLTEP